MHLYQAEQLARSLMQQHGLLRDGWRFRFSNAKRQLGSAHIRRQRDPATGRTIRIKTIRLSRHLVTLNTEHEVRDTILHEIAHALAGLSNGHNAKWKAVCRRIGARPVRLAGEEVIAPAPRYRVVCNACRRVLAHRHRRVAPASLRRSYCRSCGPASKGALRLDDTHAAAGC